MAGASRESDTTIWLNNKLGSTDDLWSGNSICSQLSRERLLSITDCFHTLQAHVKVKLLLAFLHVSKRNIEEWKEELEDMYRVACNDSDMWVSTIADILKTFPSSGFLNPEVKESQLIFHEVISDLKKLVKKQQETRLFPLECSCLSRAAMHAFIGTLPHPTKHFALKRKPKSATLRVELLQKSSDAANNLKRNVSTVPVKMRSFAKKIDNDAPLRGIQQQQGARGFISKTNSVMGRFSSGSNKRESVNQKEGGIKLIDFDALPLSAKEMKKKRKIEMEKEKAAKKEEALLSPPPSTTLISPPSTPLQPPTPLQPLTHSVTMPDYAASLLSATASFENNMENNNNNINNNNNGNNLFQRSASQDFFTSQIFLPSSNNNNTNTNNNTNNNNTNIFSSTNLNNINISNLNNNNIAFNNSTLINLCNNNNNNNILNLGNNNNNNNILNLGNNNNNNNNILNLGNNNNNNNNILNLGNNNNNNNSNILNLGNNNNILNLGNNNNILNLNNNILNLNNNNNNSIPQTIRFALMPASSGQQQMSGPIYITQRQQSQPLVLTTPILNAPPSSSSSSNNIRPTIVLQQPSQQNINNNFNPNFNNKNPIILKASSMLNPSNSNINNNNNNINNLNNNMFSINNNNRIINTNNNNQIINNTTNNNNTNNNIIRLNSNQSNLLSSLKNIVPSIKILQSSQTGVQLQTAPLNLQRPTNNSQQQQNTSQQKQLQQQIKQNIQQQQQQNTLSNDPEKKILRLPMNEVDKLFQTYKDITRHEKILIISFMGGCRVNPYPEQGPILNIRLSESDESVQQPDGMFKPMKVETSMQLNYNTGEYKTVKKIREADNE